jgi:alpha-galactosidase
MDWVPQYGELARHSNDIPTFDDSAAWQGIMTNYNYELLLARYQAPGYFNDPDFLIVDHPNLTLDEKKSHFALWASFSAPLIISAYIPDLSKEEISYLTNEDLIAVDQDALGLQATLVSRDNTFDVLTKSLSNGDRLLTILNRGPSTASISVPMERIGYSASTFATAKDLWTGDSKPVFGKVDVSVRSHATAVFGISTGKALAESVTPTGLLFNTASTHCLTAGDVLGWANCTGGDEQVWLVKKDGSISTLSAPLKCLSGKDGSVGLSVCVPRAKGQSWAYEITGNVKIGGKCLTEDGGKVSLKTCAFEMNEQVFELPSGSLKR